MRLQLRDTSVSKRGSAINWTLKEARDLRSEVGHLREDALDQLRKMPGRAEFAEAHKHIEAAVAADERTCDQLDAIIARLLDPNAQDEIELESLRSLNLCGENTLGGRKSRCDELEAKIALKKYGQQSKPTP